MRKDIEEYKSFVSSRVGIPIFYQPWWLDVVCGIGEWDAIIYKKKEKIYAILPFNIKSKLSLVYSNQPVLTPYLGIWFNNQLDESKSYDKIKDRNNAIKYFSENLKFKYFNQLFGPHFDNWSMFRWNGYQQETFYRSVLHNIKSIDIIYANIKSNKKHSIKKFKEYGEISESTDDDLLYDMIEMSYRKKGNQIQFSKDLFLNLRHAILQNGHSKIFVAEVNNKIVAKVHIIIDYNRAYFLNSGINTREEKDSNAVTALIWHAIKYSSKYVNTFDFGGSMIEPISNFFVDFGGELEPYYRISKSSSKIISIIQSIHSTN